eukprot:12075366-Ditylum_brightwellii.AAC.1
MSPLVLDPRSRGGPEEVNSLVTLIEEGAVLALLRSNFVRPTTTPLSFGTDEYLSSSGLNNTCNTGRRGNSLVGTGGGRVKACN